MQYDSSGIYDILGYNWMIYLTLFNHLMQHD